MPQSRFSIVIPCLNEEQLIAKAIESAMHAGAHEIIIVDGGSKDGTKEISQRYKCHFVESIQPGRGSQMAEGARLADGDVLVFLHADCQLGIECLNQIEMSIANHPDRSWGAFSQTIQAKGLRYRWIERANASRARRGNVYGDQTMWVKRCTYDQVGGFPEVPLMEDVEISKLLKRIAQPVVLAGPVSITDRHWRRRGVIRTTIRNWALLFLHRIGFSTERIAAIYKR